MSTLRPIPGRELLLLLLLSLSLLLLLLSLLLLLLLLLTFSMGTTSKMASLSVQDQGPTFGPSGYITFAVSEVCNAKCVDTTGNGCLNLAIWVPVGGQISYITQAISGQPNAWREGNITYGTRAP